MRVGSLQRRVLLGSAMALGAPAIGRGAAPLALRFAHFAAVDHPAHLAALQFAAQVAARTDGAISITVYPNSQLGDPPAQAEQIKAGTIDIGLPTQGQLGVFARGFAAVSLPFLFESRAHVFRVLDGPAMDWLAPQAAAQGFVVLRNWDYGFRNLSNNRRPVQTPDDVKGLRIRVPPELGVEAAMQACGGITAAVAFPELYLALSQNRVDGQENPTAVIWFNKYYEVQKYLALTQHVFTSMVHTVAAASWQKLTPAQQDIFRQESLAAGTHMRQLIGDGETRQLADLAARGVAVSTPPLRPFRALMAPAYDKIAAYAGAEEVAHFRAMTETARESL